MRLFRTHHQRAEEHLDVAVGLLISAQENVKLAAEHNDTARRVHMAAIEYHSERMAETHERNDEINEWLSSLEGVRGNG